MGRVTKWTVNAKGKRSVYLLWLSCPQSTGLHHNVYRCCQTHTTHSLWQSIVWQIVSTSSTGYHQAEHKNIYANRNCLDRKKLPLYFTSSTNTRQSVHWIQWHLEHFLQKNYYYYNYYKEITISIIIALMVGINLMFSWPCIAIYQCNRANKMHYLLSVYYD
jgi:hypothetical protein